MVMTEIELVQAIKNAKKAYYEGSPTISDKEYDALEEALKAINPTHPILATVGHPPSSTRVKATHIIPMGSLQKIHTQEDFDSWVERAPDNDLVLQWKMDGSSISIEYSDSHFVRAITRGDGSEGEDISDNVPLMSGFQKVIQDFTGAVRCEVMMDKDTFEKLNDCLPEEDRYENTRMAAAGISRRLDGLYSNQLHLFAYDLSTDGPLKETDKLLLLKNMGFDTPEQWIGPPEFIKKAFKGLSEIRPTLRYSIDGAVVKIDDYDVQQALGWVDGRPKGQVAWKFEPPGAITQFIKETWDVGRTGVVTPLAHLEPVRIDGSTISKATLHNVAQIKRLGIGYGDTVMLTKRGDIIPAIEEVLEHKGKPIEIPTQCPACQSTLDNDGVRLFCRNDHCHGKTFYRILNWIKVAKIDGFGESLAAALRDLCCLNEIQDIYRLNGLISQLPGWGLNSEEKIIGKIQDSKTMSAEVFLTALGIPGLSTKTAEDLLKAFKTLDGVRKASYDDVMALKGFAQISAYKVVDGLMKFSQEIDALLKIVTIASKAQGKLSGKTFCFTGAMSQPRSVYQGLVTKHGGQNLSGVTKDLNYLVCNEDNGSSKSQKAAKLGTRIISEKDFLDMVGEESTQQPAMEMPSLFELEP